MSAIAIEPGALAALASRCEQVFGPQWNEAAARALHQEVEFLVESAEQQGRRAVADAALELSVYLCSLVEADLRPTEAACARIAAMAKALVASVPAAGGAATRVARPSRARSPLVLQLVGDADDYLEIAAALGRRGFLVDRADDLPALEKLLERRAADALLIDPSWIDRSPDVLRSVERFSQSRLADPACFAMLPGGERNQRLFALRAGVDRVLELSEPEDIAQAVADFIQARRRTAFRVLVVEDDPAQAMFAQAVLGHRGIETEVAKSATEALAMTAEYRPDLILLDLHLPDRNGIELAQLLRERPGFDYVQIVFLSGEPSMEEHFRAIRLGADDWLSKPIKPRHLLAAVDGRAERARRLRARGLAVMGEDQRSGLLSRERLIEEIEQARKPGPGAAGCLVALAPREPIGPALGIDFLAQGTLSEELCQALLAQSLTATGVCRAEPFLFLFLVDGREAEPEQKLRDLQQKLSRRRWLSSAFPLELSFVLGGVRLGPRLPSADAAVRAAFEQLAAARVEDEAPVQFAEEPAESAETPRQRTLRQLFAREAFADYARFEYRPWLPIRGRVLGQYQLELQFAVDDEDTPLQRDVYLAYAREHGAVARLDRWLLAQGVQRLRERIEAGGELGLWLRLTRESLEDDSFAAWLRAELSRRGLSQANLTLRIDVEDLRGSPARMQRLLRPLVEASVRIAVGPLQNQRSDLDLCRLDEIATVICAQIDGEPAADVLHTALEYGKTVVVDGVDEVGWLAELFHTPLHYVSGAAVSTPLPTPEFEFPALV